MPQTNSTKVQFNIQLNNDLTRNVEPLLHEVKHSLHKLIDTGKTNIIDLRSIPLAPGEEDKIIESLGEGEVRALLNALGASEIVETKYSGVWLVTHYNEDNEIISRFIEITFMPEILRSQKEDIKQAHKLLSEILESEKH